MPTLSSTERDSNDDTSGSHPAPQRPAIEAVGHSNVSALKGNRVTSSATTRLRLAIPLLIGLLLAVFSIGLYIGYSPLDLSALSNDPMARAIFFRLRLPRVVMAGIVGASLAMVGAALQALFRNPLADPFTLGVSGGAALGSSLAIALGVGVSVIGVPLIFLSAFIGAGVAVLIVYRLARTGGVVLPGALLLAGIVLNLCASSGVLVIEYLADASRA